MSMDEYPSRQPAPGQWDDNDGGFRPWWPLVFVIVVVTANEIVFSVLGHVVHWVFGILFFLASLLGIG